MRGPQDLVRVRFNLECGITLDKERVQADPVFRMIAQTSSCDTQAVTRYLIHYLNHEQVLAEMPSTNGPADVFRVGVDGAQLTAALAGSQSQISE